MLLPIGIGSLYVGRVRFACDDIKLQSYCQFDVVLRECACIGWQQRRL